MNARPHRRDIWSALCTSYNVVDDDAWRDALTTRAHVGTCGDCQQPLKPGEPYTVGGVTWYPAECVNGHPTAAHGPQPEKEKGPRRPA